MAASAHRRINALWRYLQPETKTHDVNIANEYITEYDGSTGGDMQMLCRTIIPGTGINQRTGWKIKLTSVIARIRINAQTITPTETKTPFVSNPGEYIVALIRDIRVGELVTPTLPTWEQILDNHDAADFRRLEDQRSFRVLAWKKVRFDLHDNPVKVVEIATNRNMIVEYKTDAVEEEPPLYGEISVGILPCQIYPGFNNEIAPTWEGVVRLNYQDI